jgi:hypothetical protein
VIRKENGLGFVAQRRATRHIPAAVILRDMLRIMATFWRYVRIQLVVFVFGIVGPIFLIIFFATQPDPSTKWAYWAGLFITAAEVLGALAITSASD